MEELKVYTRDGVQLPVASLSYGTMDSKVINIIVSHGLGIPEPSEKSYKKDICWSVVDQASRIVATKAPSMGLRSYFYTARGHGTSQNWQFNGKKSLQFQWQELADDISDIVTQFQIGNFVAVGNSMGSASTIWASIKNPDNFRAIILIQPPTAWETRRKEHILGSQCIEDYRDVLLGASESDLPSKCDPRYKSVTCPILILCTRNDPIHPLSTSTDLMHLFSNATMVVTESYSTAKEEWPPLIAEFLISLS